MFKKSSFRCAAALAVPLFFSAFAHSAETEKFAVESIQKVLTAQHATWTAKENWVTRLPLDQIKRMMGLRNPPNTDAEFATPEKIKSRYDAAVNFDWRNKDGLNWISPILNQGNCGSCVAFAAVGVLESQVNITSGIPGLNPSYSTQALFACGGGGCESGWQPDSAADYLASTGVPDEACAPYTSGSTGQDVACSAVCSDASSRSIKLVHSNQETAGTRDIDAVKKALAHGPLVTTMTVYGDFIAYSGGIYKHVTGNYLGGHAVAIVGYDDAGRYWIVRNNWGGDWGEGGFFRVSWDDTSGISQETWAYEVPQVQGYVSVRNPHGRKFLSGSVNLNAESTFPQTTQVQLTVMNLAQSTAIKMPACAQASCTLTADTHKWPNGKYEVYATATWGGGKSGVSEHEQFYVFNGTAQPTLSYTLEGGVDLSQPLVDRIVFDLTTSSGDDAVPLSQITLHVAKDGKEVVSKTSYLVVPAMTLGWRTNSIPDGKYEIWLSGSLIAPGINAQVSSPHVTVTTKNGV